MNFTINETMIIGAISAIAAYLIKGLIERNKELKDKAEKTLIDQLAKATEAIKECTDQLKEHEFQLKEFSKVLAMLPKFQNDVNAAHEKIRGMEIRLHAALGVKEGNGS